MARVKDILPTRREVLRWGGLALAGTSLDHLVWPIEIHANGNSEPRGTARNCIFIEMGGAISPMDCWDFKETRYTPKDLDMVQLKSDLAISRTLFPELHKEMDKVALVRSMRAPELIHFNGQYHTQTGRALNVAIAREIPSFGSIISYELEAQRRETDTFPTFMSTQLTHTRARGLDRRRLSADAVHGARSRPHNRVRIVCRRHTREQGASRGAFSALERARRRFRDGAPFDGLESFGLSRVLPGRL